MENEVIDRVEKQQRNPMPTSAEGLTREQRRSRRKRTIRALTIRIRDLTAKRLEEGRRLYPETGYWRPRCREDCVGMPRPCPYVSCRYHLYLDVSPRTGSIKLNFPDLEVWEMGETCALDIADRDGTTLEECGAILNMTRERARQIETRAMAKAKMYIEAQQRGLLDYVDQGADGGRSLPDLTLEEPTPEGVIAAVAANQGATFQALKPLFSDAILLSSTLANLLADGRLISTGERSSRRYHVA